MILKLATSAKKRLSILFLTPHTPPIEAKDGRYIVLLTPAFYWFKAQELPVKRVSQAKEIAPSLFDGTIDEGNYSYMAIKREEGFWLFAYDDTLIANRLTQIGLKPSQIDSIYFAQSECFDIPEAIEVDERYALISTDGIVSLAPLAYVPHHVSFKSYFDNHSFSKDRVSVNFFQNSFIDEKYIYTMMLVSILFIVLYLGEYLLIHQQLTKESLRSYTLTQKYALPETSFEIKGLKNSLKAKEKRQIELREDLKKLLALPLQKGEYITKIELKEKMAHLEVMLSEPKRAETIKRHLQKSMKITKAKVIDNLLLLGVKYE